jgi:hypothetical protein
MRMRSIVLAMNLTLLVGCAGNGEGLDENGRPVEQDDGSELSPNFDSIQANVLTPLCTTCHSGAAAPLGLRLDEGASYALLVNAPSTEVPSLLRVDPGNPDGSYLIQKLEGTAAVGARMPLGGSPLSAETIGVICQWIAEGAQASSSLQPSAPSLTAVWPLDGSDVSGATTIVIAADRELDTSLLSAGTLKLARSGEDSDFNNGNEVELSVRVQLRSVSPTVITVSASPESWIRDVYQLRVSGSPPLALADLSSTAVDGDLDGHAGGDFELNFSVEGNE